MRCLNPFLHPFILFALVLSLATCKGVESTYDQPKPVDKSWRPYVVKATMPGVPDENIAVDTASRTLTVTLPENYSLLRTSLSFTLSCDSCMVGYTPKNKTLRVSFPDLNLYPERPAVFELMRTGYHEPTRYSLLLKPTGPLKIGPLTEPLVAERGGDYSLPISVSNYLDGLVTKAIFINKATGVVDESLARFCDCPTDRANQVWISVGNLLPGEYTVQLAKTGGRTATINQPLLVRRGKIRFSYIAPAVAGARTTEVRGLNLYADRRPELLITNAQGYSARLPISNVSENNEQAEAALPANIPPGYYWAQLAEADNIPTTAVRFIIQRSSQQPYVVSLTDSLTRYIGYDQSSLQQTTGPIDFTANKKYQVEFSRLSPIRKHQIRLMPVEGGQSPVLIDITIDRSYYLAGPDSGTFPSFWLPTTLQPGRYRLTLLVYKDETTFDESEPLEREIRIR